MSEAKKDVLIQLAALLDFNLIGTMAPNIPPT
jgi:hypothetical protein